MITQNYRYDLDEVPHYERFYNGFVKTSPILNIFIRVSYENDYQRNKEKIKETIIAYELNVIPDLKSTLKKVEDQIKEIWLQYQKSQRRYTESTALKKEKFKLEAELDVAQLELQVLKNNLAKLKDKNENNYLKFKNYE